MKRDVIVSVFLFFFLLALTFILFFPVYFTYGQIMYRSVSVIERILSVVFVLLWLALCAFSAYYKKLTYLFGGVLYSFLAYVPGMLLPGLSAGVSGAEPDLFSTLADGFLRRLYELINAPMTGISVLFPPEKAAGLSKWMLPVLLISYVVTQIFRFYRNAYLADQLLLNDTPQTVSPSAHVEKARVVKTDPPGFITAFRSRLSALRERNTGNDPERPVPEAELDETAASEETGDVLTEETETGDVSEDKAVTDGDFDISLSTLEEKASNPDIKE